MALPVPSGEIKKKPPSGFGLAVKYFFERIFYFRRFSSETVSFFLPARRRAANTFLPFDVAILLRKPCLLALFLRDGW